MASPSVVKNLPANSGDTRDMSSIPESGRSPGEGKGNPLQYSFLENSLNRGAWKATVHGVSRVKQDLVIQLPPPNQLKDHWLSPLQGKDQQGHTIRSITHSGLLNSFLENSMDRGSWQAILHEVAKSQTQLATEHTHHSFSYQASFHSVEPLVWSTLQEMLEISPIFFLCDRDQKHIITNHNHSLF